MYKVKFKEIEIYIFLITLIGILRFYFQVNHTSFEWTTSGLIPIIIRLINDTFITNDFYTNSSIESPKFILSFVIYQVTKLGFWWHDILFFLKYFFYLTTPILIYLIFTKLIYEWAPQNIKETNLSILKFLCFLGSIGGFAKFVSLFDPSLGWGPIQGGSDINSMNLSFYLGLIYLLFSFKRNSYFLVRYFFLICSIILHPTMGLLSFSISIIFLLPKYNELTDIVKYFIEFLICCTIPIIILSYVFDNQDYLTKERFFEIYVLLRHPHHYLVSALISSKVILWLFVILVPLVISIFMKNIQLIFLSTLVALSFIVALLMQFVGTEIFANKIIMKFGPLRYFTYFSLVFSANILILMSYALKSNQLIKLNILKKIKIQRFYKIALLIFLLLIAGYVFSNTNKNPLEYYNDGSTGESIDWISENTSKDAIILPYGYDSLDPALIRVFAERAIFADYMMVFNEKYMNEFAERFVIYKEAKNKSIQELLCLSKRDKFHYVIASSIHKNKISEEHLPDFTSEKWIIYNLSNFNLNNGCKE